MTDYQEQEQEDNKLSQYLLDIHTFEKEIRRGVKAKTPPASMEVNEEDGEFWLKWYQPNMPDRASVEEILQDVSNQLSYNLEIEWEKVDNKEICHVKMFPVKE